MNDGVQWTRRRLLALLGVGASGTAVAGRWGVLRASVSPPGGGVAPTTEPPLFTLPPVPTTESALLSSPAVPTVADLAASLRWDVEAMFRYVADEVDYQAYTGALRGAQATLWGRAGNSVDKAMLLGALLEEAGVPWRFAVGELDVAAQEALMSRGSRSLAESRRRLAEVVLPPDVAGGWSGEGEWQRDDVVDELFRVAAQRVDATYTVLVDALTGAGVEPPEPARLLPAEEVMQHAWVQVADGAVWVDLDATLRGAVFGEPLTWASETVTELPEDFFHTVTFRLVAEVVAGGVPTLTEVVAHSVRAAEVGGVPIYVVHAPASWLDVGGAVASDQRYRPAILVGSELVEAAMLVTLDKGEGALEALGEESTAEGQTLAEWLEVDVSVPGAGLRTERRLVFDRIAAERRQSGNLGLDELPPIALTHIGDIGDVYLPCASPFIISIVSQLVPWSGLGLDRNVPPTADDLVARSSLACPYVHDLVALNQAERLGGVVRLDEPLVSALRVAPGAGDQPVVMTVDRLHVHYAVDRLAPVEAASWIGVAAGALGHAAERSLVDAMSWVLGGATSAVETSVGSVFDRVLEVGADLRVLTPREARALPPMTPTGRVLVHEALNAGRYVVIPTSPVELGGEPRIGWWEYDPVSGQIVDRMDDGGHVTAAEWAALIKGIMIGVSCGMVALGFAVAAAGSMGQANTAGRDFIVGATAITTGFAGSGCVSAISFPL